MYTIMVIDDDESIGNMEQELLEREGYQVQRAFSGTEALLHMDALPPRKTMNDKYYIGFFKRDKLIAVMDLIMNYPKKKTAFIGLFMMDVNYQNKGIGSRVIGEVLSYLKSENYEKIRLGVDKGNPQSYSFWNKNGFVTVEENQYIIMERIIMYKHLRNEFMI